MVAAFLRCSVVCLAFAAAWASPTHAQNAPPDMGVTLTIETCAEPAPHEAEDQAAVDAAMTAYQQSGLAGLAAHLEALRGVLANAPACYPRLERRGGDIIVRSEDPAEYAVIAALLRALPGEATPSPDTYPQAALLLAVSANASGRYDEAINWLDVGLALQPRDPFLILEKASAFLELRRADEAASMLEAALGDPANALTLDRPRFLRSLGVALIDLNRLDDAEAAFRQSLELEPGNARAQSELDYIARLRAGGPRVGTHLNAPEPQPPTPQAPTPP